MKKQLKKILITNHLQINMNHPDPKKHQLVSFLKSGVRLLGYIFLPFNLYIAMGVLLVSEIIGIIEELV